MGEEDRAQESSALGGAATENVGVSSNGMESVEGRGGVAAEGMAMQREAPDARALAAADEGHGSRGGAPAPMDSTREAGAAQLRVRDSPGEGGAGSWRAAEAATKGQEGDRAEEGISGSGPKGVLGAAEARVGVTQPSGRARQENRGGDAVAVTVTVLVTVGVAVGVSVGKGVMEGLNVADGLHVATSALLPGAAHREGQPHGVQFAAPGPLHVPMGQGVALKEENGQAEPAGHSTGAPEAQKYAAGQGVHCSFRTLFPMYSIANTSPEGVSATPVGLLRAAEVPNPSTLLPEAPIPASVVTTPSGDTARMLPAPLSATSTPPPAAVTMRSGPMTDAAAPAPSTPADAPLPHLQDRVCTRTHGRQVVLLSETDRVCGQGAKTHRATRS